MGKAAGKVNGRPKLSRRVESFWLPLSQQKPNKTKKNLSVLRDSVVNKNKTKYLKGVPKVFIGLLTKDLWVLEKIMRSWSQSEFEPNRIISATYLR